MRPVKDKYLKEALIIAINHTIDVLNAWKIEDSELGHSVQNKFRHNIRMFKRRLGLKEDGR